MAKKPIVVVMAAGMGSRYGGLKQIDPVGSCGEAILDYSIYDAYEAGFRTAVIIIKEAIREDFMSTVGKRLEKCPMEIRYAYQEQTSMLPAGTVVPPERGAKPWGTGHAILSARDAIDGAPFAVVNADDYYGKAAYKAIFNALSQAKDGEKADWYMVGYLLGNTVTEHGSVSRGVCSLDETGCLAGLTERTRIVKQNGTIAFTEDGENWTVLPEDTIVSMNLFGFTPRLLEALGEDFPKFIREEVPLNPAKKEFHLPGVVNRMLAAGKARLKVLSSPDRWYGVTYAADKPAVIAALRQMTEEGKYPDGLWK